MDNNNHFFINHYKISLLLITIAGLTLRILRAMSTTSLNQDAVEYIKFAQLTHESGLETGYSVISWLPPMLPFLMAKSYYFNLTPCTFGIIINIFFGTILIITAYFFTKTFFNDIKASLLSALLIAFNPFLVSISADIIRDNIFYVFSILSFIFIRKAIENKNLIYYTLSAITSSLAVFTRSEGIEIFIICVILILYSIVVDHIKNKKLSFKKIFYSNVYLIIFLLILLPVHYKLSSYKYCSWTIIPKELIFVK